MAINYNRQVLVTVLVFHWKTNTSACGGCDEVKLGESYPEHIADVYERTVRALAVNNTRDPYRPYRPPGDPQH